MKSHVVLVLLALFCQSLWAEADRINSKESLERCKNAILAEAGGSEYAFSRKTATSVKSDLFKHWINATERKDNEKSSVKILCETSRTGEVLSLRIQPGRWNI